MRFAKPITLFCATILFSTAATVLPALAQSIQVDQLTPASAYDAGVLDQSKGGLGPSLWQGSSAAQAIAVLEKTRLPLSPSAHTLARAALLSGGVPPESTNETERAAYMAARLSAILKLEDMESFDAITQRENLNKNDPAFAKIFAQRALLGGNASQACTIADTNTQGRKEPYWIKLRGFCHYTRGELPAAELTMELLRRKGHKDDSFYTLLGYLSAPKKTNFSKDIIKTPLDIAMARKIYAKQQMSINILPAIALSSVALNMDEEPETQLMAMKKSAHLVPERALIQILSVLADAPLEDVNTLKTGTWTAKDWGGAYLALKSSMDMKNTAKLTAAILQHAQKAGQFKTFAALLSQEISMIPQQIQANTSPEIFAYLAVQNRDLGGLGLLYGALDEDNPLRPRIALASDALGGGYMLSALGTDIESRLSLHSKDQKRAIRDTYIAVALGANLSHKAENLLAKAGTQSGTSFKPYALLALKAAARRGAQAQTALIISAMLGNIPPAALRPDAFAQVLMALREAGMNDFATQLAAQDFLGL
ncbi:MAG: hypothetical protein V3U57_02245 [Robiginitomaculum sp.]